MLLQFSVKNFRTFKDKAIISLIASNYDKETREIENIYSDENFRLRLLKSAVIYGANASGKSKLVDAFAFMKYFVINSSKESQKGETIDVHPFRLSDETENEPSEFETIFLFEDVVYRYGFEAAKEKIILEWLYYKPKTKEVELFYRDGTIIKTHNRNFAKGNTIVKEGLVRDNALLVSVSAQFNEKTAISVIDWFKRLRILSGLNESGYQGFTMGRTEDPEHKAKILELLKAADLGIQDIKLQKLDIGSLPKGMPKELRDKIIREVNEDKKEFVSDVLTTHRKYNINKIAIDNISFSLDEDESSGTGKFFALTGPILDVIENGYTLVVDELDSKLHPNLVCKIVSLFNSKELNKKNAQLIFNTHDTNLLSSGLFRRDQIWFTNKDKYGEAKLYSLADFKSDEVRKTDPFEENYVRGKYGAVPFLGFFDHLRIPLSQYENEKQKAEQIAAKQKHKELLKAQRRSEPVLERPPATLIEKPSILIVCEGKIQEPSYFNQFRLSSATVQSVGEGYNTLSLVNRAIQLSQQGNFDQVWCVFDKDDFSENDFNNAIQTAQSQSFGLAYSNQAFEYWLILHFDDHQGEECIETITTKKINKMLKPYKVKYDGNGSKMVEEDFFELLESFDEKTKKEKSGVSYYEGRERNYDQFDHLNPALEESSTTVYRLVKELLKYL